MGLFRLILAISVVAAHSGGINGIYFVEGRTAVKIFFIISGFYMGLVLSEKYNKDNSYSLFLTNRILRLFPGYWIVLIATLLLGLFIPGMPGISSYQHLASQSNLWPLIYATFSNLFMLGQDTITFFTLTPDGGLYLHGNLGGEPLDKGPFLYSFLLLPQAWSLGMELMFYIMAPWLVRRKNYILFMLMAASLLIRVSLLAFDVKGTSWSYHFFPSELIFFMAGIVAYRIYAKYKDKFNSEKTYLAISILFVFVFVYQLIPQYLIKNILFYLVVVTCLPLLFQMTKNIKYDKALGELSYPVYLVHLLIIYLARSNKPLMDYLATHPQYSLGLFTLISSIVMSILITKFIETPINKIRSIRVEKKKQLITLSKTKDVFASKA